MNIRQKLISITLALGAVFAAPQFAHAVTLYGGSVDTTKTTLSAAVTIPVNGNNQQICVASATNINVTSISQTGTYLVIDKEAVQVTTAGSSTTCFNVKRGQLGTAPAGHISGRNVWVGNVATGSGDSSRPFSGGAITSNVPTGSCTASQQYSLPVIFVGQNNFINTGFSYYCDADVWSAGQSQQTGGQASYTSWTTYPTPGNVVAPVAVTDVSGKLFFSQVIPLTNTLTTGACILNGSGAGTDNYIFALWDASGTLVTTTALAGTASSGASLLQCIAWTTPIVITGPNAYFVGVQGNGTTAAQFSGYKTGGAPTGYLTGAQTGGTFGTVLDIATANIPTTFTTGLGPYMSLY